eukprot:scaffold207536_cov51-Attheya_sp.AAC.4
MKYSLHSLFEYSIVTVTDTTSRSNGNVSRTTKVRKPLMLDEIERRIRILSVHSKCQSDGEMPRAAFNKGVSQLSGINGQEYVGLSMLTIAALPGMLKNITLERQFMKLLWKDYMSKVDKTELEHAELGNMNITRATPTVSDGDAEPEVMYKMIRRAFAFEKFAGEWNTVTANQPLPIRSIEKVVDNRDGSTKYRTH